MELIKKVTKMNHKMLALAMISVLATPLVVAKDYSSVNKNINITMGEKANDISSVNGDVLVQTKAQVGEISTVNGTIRVDENASLVSINSVNGNIKLAKGVVLSKDLESVNGNIELAHGGVIKGNIFTVNGNLKLTGAKIKGDINVVNADVELADGTVVEGGLTVKAGKSRHWFFGLFSSSDSNKPTIIFGNNVVIKGPVIFEREVKLTIADNAKVPNIEYSYKK